MAAAAVAVLLCSGCAATIEQALYEELDSSATYQRLVVDSPHGAAEDRDVLALSPAVIEVTDRLKTESRNPRHALRSLAELFVPGSGLDLHFEMLGAYSATETFELRLGNCLSFTHLFIAMARELGLDARYREVFDAQRWDERGDFALLNRHVVAYGQLGSSHTYQADFGYVDWLDDRFGDMITDDRARAMHFNNLGALAMTDGDYVDAVRHFTRGLLIDRAVSYLWANLGTAYARLDEPVLAEHAYREALRIDAYDVTAVNQLGRLYDRLGEDRLATFYRERGERMLIQNPYRLFHEGTDAMAEGDYGRAVVLLRQAARVQPNRIHFRIELGKALAMNGDPRRARRELHAAAGLVERVEDQHVLAEALEYLQNAPVAADYPSTLWVDVVH